MNASRNSAARLGAFVALTVLVTACQQRGEPAADTAAGAAPATQQLQDSGMKPPMPGDSGMLRAPGDTAAQTSFLDPDAASAEQLQAVPGMTVAAAQAVIAARPHADMRSVDKALQPHLDSAARRTVYARVWKPIDLNKASKEEILLIPGVGRRMLHEFEEYRPYTSMAQFRREIGKYVKQDELDRLARYVSVR